MVDVRAAGCAVDHPLCMRPVIRMYALKHHIQRWFLRAVVPENPKGFLCPDNLARIRIPPEAACVAEALGFCQIRLAPPEFRIDGLHLIVEGLKLLIGSLRCW